MPHFLSDLCFLITESMWSAVSLFCSYAILVMMNHIPLQIVSQNNSPYQKLLLYKYLIKNNCISKLAQNQQLSAPKWMPIWRCKTWYVHPQLSATLFESVALWICYCNTACGTLVARLRKQNMLPCGITALSMVIY